MLAVMVKALVTADGFQAKLSSTNFRLNVIDVTIGIPPAVTVQLVPKSA